MKCSNVFIQINISKCIYFLQFLTFHVILASINPMVSMTRQYLILYYGCQISMHLQTAHTVPVLGARRSNQQNAQNNCPVYSFSGK